MDTSNEISNVEQIQELPRELVERIKSSTSLDLSLEEASKKICSWATCFCVVTFDLELGQKLEWSFPPTKFTDAETTNLSFHSFPDSNSGLSGDIQYCFRYKKMHDFVEDNDTNHFKTNYYYGYVFFRQEKDASIKRGYLQKSVVLVSDYPYYGLFKKVVSLVGPLYFEYGYPLLEAAYQNLCSWPSPKPGKNFELPFLGNILSFHVPFSLSPHIIDPTIKKNISGAKELLVSNLESINLYKCFYGILPKLWQLWELMLIGEPILLLSGSPPECSEAVLGLVSLIAPLTYGGDYRPFFTIYDTDFKNYTSSTTFPSLVLGVTNPFFCKALEHWPHICSIGETPEHKKNLNARRGSRGNKLVSDFKQELKTKYKTLANISNKDDVLQQIIKSASPQAFTANNEILRRHFLQLTETFLIPLERYFTSLMPLAKEISVFKKPPKLKVFDEQEFLNVLNSPLNKKNNLSGKLEDLYTRFIRSSNFQLWFNLRRKEAIAKLNLLYQKTLVESDMKQLLQHRKEVEIIDLMIRVQELLDVAHRKGQLDVVSKLEDHLNCIISCLPKDLQKSIQIHESSKQIYKIEDSDEEETTL